MGRPDGRPTSAGDAVGQGIELVGQVSATAAELIRTRRDPVLAAQRRRRAAVRRVQAWSVGAVVSGGVTAAAAANMIGDGPSTVAIVILVGLVAVLIWTILGVVRAVSDLRERTRAVRALPPPQPARAAVAGAIRPEMKRLDGYSDGLRQLVGMIGVVDDATVRSLRDEILRSADDVEARLRAEASSLSAVLKARRSAPPDVARELDATSDHLRRAIVSGVDGYGELVSAASEAVSASRALSGSSGGLSGGVSGGASGTQPGTASGAATGRVAPGASGGPGGAGADSAAFGGRAAAGELQASADQLRALAAGMRELTQG